MGVVDRNVCSILYKDCLPASVGFELRTVIGIVSGRVSARSRVPSLGLRLALLKVSATCCWDCVTESEVLEGRDRLEVLEATWSRSEGMTTLAP
jgi:hypothetical protein